LPYEIDWKSVNEIQEVAQVVDGNWTLLPEGIRPIEIGYDRLVAIGDMTWSDYEVTVPITVHKAEPVFSYPSHGALVGVLLRWQGHQDWGNGQPNDGWWPLGALAHIQWVSNSQNSLYLAGNKALSLDHADRQFQVGETYVFKIRAETIPGKMSMYRFKVWNSKNAEPSDWDLGGIQPMWDPLYGSLLLVAHHVDATFGNITVTPVVDKSPWEWFITLGPYLVILPILLACLAGIGLSIYNRHLYPKISRYVLIASILLFFESILGIYLNYSLPVFLHRQQWGTHEIGLALVAKDGLMSLITAISLGLLLAAIFRWRKIKTDDLQT